MYIVMEGIDFAGKSTLGKQIAETIKARFTMEPFTETKEGKELKAKLVSNTMTKDQEIQGYAVARLAGFKAVVGPYVSHARTVISDRNVLSSMVYQSDNNVLPEEVLDINRRLLELNGFNILPDLVLFCDIDHETFIERFNKAEKEGRAVDAKDRMFLDKRIFEEYREKYFASLRILEKRGVCVRILTKEIANVSMSLEAIKEAKELKAEKEKNMRAVQHQAKMARFFAEV